MKPLRDVTVMDDEKTIADLAREQRELIHTTEVVGALIEKVHQLTAAVRERDSEIGVLEDALADRKRELDRANAEIERLSVRLLRRRE